MVTSYRWGSSLVANSTAWVSVPPTLSESTRKKTLRLVPVGAVWKAWLARGSHPRVSGSTVKASAPRWLDESMLLHSSDNSSVLHSTGVCLVDSHRCGHHASTSLSRLPEPAHCATFKGTACAPHLSDFVVAIFAPAVIVPPLNSMHL